MQILTLFSSQHLLFLAAVSHRFHDIAAHIVYGRLTVATSLEDRKLILECYHPTNQYTEPYLFCESLDTPGQSNEIQSPGSKGDFRGEADCSRTIATLYSSFKPVRVHADSKPFRPHSAESIPDTQNIVDPPATSFVSSSEDEDNRMTRSVHLDNDELFSQLCISIALVQLGPRHGVFLSCTDILKKRTARIWRQWLLENSSDSGDGGPERIIWADQARNVGLKVQVREMKGKHHASILQPMNENQAISYKLDLEGVYLRFCSGLKVGVEKSIEQSKVGVMRR